MLRVGGDGAQGLGGRAEQDAVDHAPCSGRRWRRSSSGTVKTTWKYSQSSSSASRSSIHCARASDWHFGQCRFAAASCTQMRWWPQGSHCSTWPPSAAVRHRSIAVMTRRCAVDSDAPCCSTIGVAVAAEDVRHLQRRRDPSPRRSEVLRRAGGRSRSGPGRGSKSSGLVVAQTLVRGDAQIAGGGRQAAMAEQQLNRADVGAGFEQVDGEGVAQANAA